MTAYANSSQKKNLEVLGIHLLRATEIIPPKTKAAPRTKRALGSSAKISTPSRVAAIGSIKARAAVSNDLRLERDEKYNVCAKVVGKMPNTTSIRTDSRLRVKVTGAAFITTLATSTVRADSI